jgi:putative MFS transporter
MLSKEKRGLGSAIIATSGVFGSIAAYFVFDLSGRDWRLCYFIGGGMGLALLFLRVKVLESSMYDATKDNKVPMGNFLMFFTKKERFLRYMKGVLIGLPVWFVIGVLIGFSNEFARCFKIEGFDQPKSLMLQYLALAFGDMGAGFLSNYIKSRKKTLILYYIILSIFIFLFFYCRGGGSATNMYLLCMGLGFGSGISVLYITMSAEQFGTNLRATAAISIPNLVRGFLPLILILFKGLRNNLHGPNADSDYVTAAWMIGILVLVIGFVAVLFTKETFGKDLNFTEK